MADDNPATCARVANQRQSHSKLILINYLPPLWRITCLGKCCRCHRLRANSLRDTALLTLRSFIHTSLALRRTRGAVTAAPAEEGFFVAAMGRLLWPAALRAETNPEYITSEPEFVTKLPIAFWPQQASKFLYRAILRLGRLTLPTVLMDETYLGFRPTNDGRADGTGAVRRVRELLPVLRVLSLRNLSVGFVFL